MALSSQDVETATSLTLEHYNGRANDFWEGTRGHDVSQNIAALLQYIDGQPPLTILDLGCGPGRDVKAFKELGHVVVGVGNGAGDGSEGAVRGRVVGTYLHGPVLARNPALADRLLSWALGDVTLGALDDEASESLRQERLATVGGTRRRRRRT